MYKYVVVKEVMDGYSATLYTDCGSYGTAEEAFLNKPEDETGGFTHTYYIVEVREVEDV